MKPVKFSAAPENAKPYIYSNTWQIEATTGPNRIVLAPASSPIDLILKLTRDVPEPFGILYVLVVPRGSDHEPGRYQSMLPCGREELVSFLERFRDYFEGDGRHHLWIYSLPGGAQIVYDNHDVIYGYGPIDTFAGVAQGSGMVAGEVRIPVPHSHNYNAAFDADEQRIMTYWDWKYFPLTEGDD